MTRFTVTVRRPGPETCVLDLQGELTRGAEVALETASDHLRARPAARVVLNLAGVESMDGPGVMRLFRWVAARGRGQRRPRLVGVTPRCRNVLGELGFERAAAFHTCEAEALGEKPEDLPSAASSGREACPAAPWAGHLGRAEAPPSSLGLSGESVAGRRVAGPWDGFGPLWHKRYEAALGPSVNVAGAAALLREVGRFWPPGNRIRFHPDGVTPGGLALMELRMPGGLPLRTGARVLHAGEGSFTLVTLAGHVQSGMISLGAAEDRGGTTLFVESLGRAGDPLYELGLSVFGHEAQERFWRETLAAAALHLGARAEVAVSREKVDAEPRWEAVLNVRHNAALRTGLETGGYLLLGLLRPRRRTP